MKEIYYIVGERGSRDWWASILSWITAAVMLVAAVFAFSMFFVLALVLVPVAALILWLHFRRIEKILKNAAAPPAGSTVHIRHTGRPDFRETIIDIEDDQS